MNIDKDEESHIEPSVDLRVESDGEPQIDEDTLPIPVDKPRFTEEDEHWLELQVELARRIKGLEPTVVPESVVDPQTEILQINEEPVFEGVYPATRRNMWSFLVDSWQRVGGGILLIVILWLGVSYVPGAFFGIETGSQTSWNIGLISAGITVLIIVTVFLMEIQNFMRWRKWGIEVTEKEVIIGQDRSIIGRLDENYTSLRRERVEYIRVERRWYLSFLNAYTVSFDAPTGEDTAFHDLKFIKNGKLLKELFDNKKR